MRIAVFDPAAGIAGDMALGSLVDLLGEDGWLNGLPARLGLEGVAIRVESVTRASQRATKVHVDIAGVPDDWIDHHEPDHGHHGAHVRDILARIERADLTPRVRERGLSAFRELANAEARVHGMAPDQVHLHEVGAADALIDIIGTIEGIERLGVDAIHHLPPAPGRGWTHAAHGAMPVPAPATVALLEGIELASNGPVEGEAVTPTGAVLLRVLSRGAPPERWRITATGWGAGTRNPAGYANVLRLHLGEAVDESERVEVLVYDLDDMNPEYLEPMRSAILSAGAVECVTWATQAKKGRQGVRTEVLAPPERVDAVTDAIFRHCTTAGLRIVTARRRTLKRREITIEVAPGHPVRVKILGGPDGSRIKAEYEDVVQVADRLGRPALEIAEAARKAAQAQVEHEERAT